MAFQLGLQVFIVLRESGTAKDVLCVSASATSFGQFALKARLQQSSCTRQNDRASSEHRLWLRTADIKVCWHCAWRKWTVQNSVKSVLCLKKICVLSTGFAVRFWTWCALSTENLEFSVQGNVEKHTENRKKHQIRSYFELPKEKHIPSFKYIPI